MEINQSKIDNIIPKHSNWILIYRNGGGGKDVLQKPQQRNKDAIREQLQRSALKLTRLLRDGTELVSNVVVADDKREIDRRMSEVGYCPNQFLL